MTVFELRSELSVARPLHEVFDFFADARNLERITPPWLRFSLLTEGPLEMKPGALIDYRLAVHGLPLRWTSRIDVWEPCVRFVDTQVRGPYRLWHHTHAFRQRDGGTIVADHVRYALPLGPLGVLLNALQVRRDVERIFRYRATAITRLLPPGGDVAASA